MGDNLAYETILITGGAGYIGSHVAKKLLENTQHEVIIIDNLSTGSYHAIETLSSIRQFKFFQTDLCDFNQIEYILGYYQIDVIMHFAASIVVPESIENPLKYYLNNTANTTNLFNSAVSHGVNRFIFSSTAAVYGAPKEIPSTGVSEQFAENPINPYGWSKLMSERVLRDVGQAHKHIKYVILRYFNVAGADIFYKNDMLTPRIGQAFPNATHLIKVASECAVGKRNQMAIFGEDYETADGTCVRDYIHVDDLAQAHIQAIDYLQNNASNVFNVGYGRGYSVREVIQTMKRVTSVDFKVEKQARRPGDPPVLISNSEKIKNKMQWEPKYNDLALICDSAYKWEIRCKQDN